MARPALVHPAVPAFGRVAAIYERSRPEYPPAAIRYLGRVLHLGPGTTIVDLASGTGKLTRALAHLGAARVAVEPIAGMRREFARAVPDVPVVVGTAESIPLPDGFADAVVVGQAFHWFRPAPAAREIARVLRPGGGLALLWNVRDESVPWVHAVSELLDRYRRRTPRSQGHRWRSAFERPTSPFGPVTTRRFRTVQTGPPRQFVDRFLSVSFIAGLPAAERRAVARAVARILATDPATRGRSSLSLPYVTRVHWARRKPLGRD